DYYCLIWHDNTYWLF
nr:immunoglobulin light chain junction region [Macaca mulatta]